MLKNLEIDNTDLKILSLLMEDAKMAYADVGKEVFVSGGTVHVRMKKMEQMGIVTGTQLKLNYINLGYDVNAFLGIYLRKSSMYNEVLDQLRRIPEVINVNYTTGVYSMFAKVICKDTMHLKNLLTDKIQKIPGIQRTETLIALEESINRPVQLL